MSSKFSFKCVFRAILLVSFCSINKGISQNYSVVDYQKINESVGGFIGNLDNDDSWAIAIDNIGDLDGNGVNDLAVGAYADDDGGYNRGAVWILFMDANDMVLSHTKISDISGNFNGALDDDDRFGGAVAYLGDLNGDGLVEIAVAADYDGDGGYWSGAVWILSLNSDGTVNSHSKISSSSGGFNGEIGSDFIFGTDIENIGDLNSDGVADLAVGARRQNGRRGTLWILFMNPDFTVNNYTRINNISGGLNEVLEFEDYFGGSVLNIGDLDGDGITDLVVGAYRDDDGLVNSGSFYVLFMNNDGTVKTSQKVSNSTGGLTRQISANALFGESIDGFFDIDNDGKIEILVGALGHNNPFFSLPTGAFYIIELNNDGTVSEEHFYTYGENCFTGFLNNGDFFGGSITLLQNGTNIKIAVGAYHDSDNGANRGAVWIINLGNEISGSLDYQNPSTCISEDGIITISDLTPGFEYDINYDYNGSGNQITRVSDLSGIIQLTELSSGTYTDITVGVSITGCSKNLGNLILNGTTLDVTYAITDPSICGGMDGSLKFSGLSPNTYYDISYQYNDRAEIVNFISNTNGEILTEGLSAGTYSGVTVTETGSDCTAAIGDIELSQSVLNLSFTHINPSSCNAKDGSIIIDNALPNVEYNVGFVYESSVYALNLMADINGQIVITELGAGAYIDILVTDGDDICNAGFDLVSLEATGTLITSSKTNPTTCNSSDGSIYIEGLYPNENYEFSYGNELDTTMFELTADLNGGILVSGLESGIYDNIKVLRVLDNCTQSIEQIELSCTSEFLGCFKTKKFFTPNSDGINDMWHLEIINNCDYTLFIYDRYGKLIDVLTPSDPNWDGSYLGQLMPSSDYWYNIEYTDGEEKRTFQSHFALKR